MQVERVYLSSALCVVVNFVIELCGSDDHAMGVQCEREAVPDPSL